MQITLLGPIYFPELKETYGTICILMKRDSKLRKQFSHSLLRSYIQSVLPVVGVVRLVVHYELPVHKVKTVRPGLKLNILLKCGRKSIF